MSEAFYSYRVDNIDFIITPLKILVIRRGDRITRNRDELWDVFAIMVIGFAKRRIVVDDCCPGYG